MILSRRKAHFYIVVFLSCTLPMVFLAGLLWRPSTPNVDETTDPLFAAANFLPGDDKVRVIASETLSIQGINLLAETSKSSEGMLFLDLQPSQALLFSDLLVYWITEDSTPDTVSDEAILLGNLSGSSRRHFSVTSKMQKQPGHLLFYSRSRDKVIGSTPLPSSLFP